MKSPSSTRAEGEYEDAAETEAEAGESIASWRQTALLGREERGTCEGGKSVVRPVEEKELEEDSRSFRALLECCGAAEVGHMVVRVEGVCAAESRQFDPPHAEEEPEVCWTLLRFFPRLRREARTPEIEGSGRPTGLSEVDSWGSSRPIGRGRRKALMPEVKLFWGSRQTIVIQVPVEASA